MMKHQQPLFPFVLVIIAILRMHVVEAIFFGPSACNPCGDGEVVTAVNGETFSGTLEIDGDDVTNGVCREIFLAAFRSQVSDCKDLATNEAFRTECGCNTTPVYEPCSLCPTGESFRNRLFAEGFSSFGSCGNAEDFSLSGILTEEECTNFRNTLSNNFPTFFTICDCGPEGLCFPGQSTVQVEGQGEVALDDLQLGDKVMVEGGIYEPIYSFGHHDATNKGIYNKITTRNDGSLHLSANHMLPVVRKGIIPSSLVEVGDHLVNHEGHVSSEVVSVQYRVKKDGLYAPFTPSGTIVVDGFVVSCYLAFQESSNVYIGSWESPISFHWISHIMTFPRRFYCSMISGQCLTEEYTEGDGISTWFDGGLEMARWLVKKNNVMSVITLSVVLLITTPVGLVVTLLEMLSSKASSSSPPSVAIGLTVLVGAMSAMALLGTKKSQ